MTDFNQTNLWAADGRIRRMAHPTIPNQRYAGQWESRTVVFTASNYQEAHAAAADALLHNWSTVPHEAEIYAVRPADVEDLLSFRYMSDPCMRVLVSV